MQGFLFFIKICGLSIPYFVFKMNLSKKRPVAYSILRFSDKNSLPSKNVSSEDLSAIFNNSLIFIK